MMVTIRVFSNELALHIRWPNYWSFSFIIPSNEHPGLISSKIREPLVRRQGSQVSMRVARVKANEVF